jgi:hypothetical protein
MANTMTTRPSNGLASAREKAVDLLRDNAAYFSLSLEDQRNVYQALVKEYLDKDGGLANKNGGLARSLATDSGKDMGYKGYDPSFKGETTAFTELVQSVDFPKFVADLLKAVFDANLKVMKQQTDSYIKLMKEATKSTADFIKQVKDDDTFGALVEKHSDKYNLTNDRQPDGSTKLALTTPDGSKADLEDAEIKKHMLEAKIDMAKEHRAALREVLLMGVTRLVVEKGEIDAGVDFSIKATRDSRAHHEDQNVNVTNTQTSFGGGIGALFGGPTAGMDMTNTNIQVNTSDKKATDDLSAALHGHVNIKFKTDYFQLDHFADMYAEGGVAGKGGGGGGGKPAAGGAPAGAGAGR